MGLFNIFGERRPAYQFWPYYNSQKAFPFNYTKKCVSAYSKAPSTKEKVKFVATTPLAASGDVCLGIWRGIFCNFGILYHNANAELLRIEEKQEKKKLKKQQRKKTLAKAVAATGALGAMGAAIYAAYKKGYWPLISSTAQNLWTQLPNWSAFSQSAQSIFHRLFP